MHKETIKKNLNIFKKLKRVIRYLIAKRNSLNSKISKIKASRIRFSPKKLLVLPYLPQALPKYHLRTQIRATVVGRRTASFWPTRKITIKLNAYFFIKWSFHKDAEEFRNSKIVPNKFEGSLLKAP